MTSLYVLGAWILRVLSASHDALVVPAGLVTAAMPLVVVALAVRTAFRLRSAAWWTLAAAGCTWVVATAVAEVNEVLVEQVTYPSPADALYVLVMPLILSATWMLAHTGSSRSEKLRSLFDGLFIAASVKLVFWLVVLGGERAAELGTLGAVATVIYVVTDILVVTTVQSSREIANRERLDLRLLAIAFTLLTFADGLYAYQRANDSYGGLYVPDLAWLAAFAVLGWGAVHGRQPTGGQVRQKIRDIQLLAVGSAALAATAWTIVAKGELEAMQGGCIIVIALIGSARQYFAQRETDELRAQLEQKIVDLSRSEHRFRAVFDGIHDGIAVVGPDRRLVSVNPSFSRMVGRPAHELIGRDTLSFVALEDRERLLRLAYDHEESITLTQSHLLTASGELLPVETSLANLTDDPTVGGFVLTMRDISQRLDQERQLSESKERFRRSFDAAPIGMVLVRSDGRIIEANGAYARMLGRTVDELVGSPIELTTHPDDIPAERERMAQMLADDSGPVQFEKRLVHAEGHHVWVSMTASIVRLPNGDHEFVKQIEDITERRATLAKLAHNARHDMLTGLANRAHFEERLAEALTAAHGTGERIAVAFFDVDRFKVVNDTLGHRHGDALLRVVASRLAEATRGDDVIARFGGDEFTALFRRIDDEGHARAVAQRVVDHVCRPIESDDGETFVSLSVGIALSTPSMDARAVDHLLRDADAAMYRAKGAGRDRIEVHVEGTPSHSADLMRLANDLHRAQERGELVMHYQPILRLDDGLVRTLEALLRWQHPTRGVVNPSQFIPLAEDTGLIVPIGAWALEEVCRQIAEWNGVRRARGASVLRATVNVSSRQLDGGDFADTVTRILRETGADPDWIWLEITEGALMRDTTETIATMRRLRDLGVHLAIDDFGTGYSSLAYLRRFPVEALKIDRSFVAGLGENEEDTTIVRAIVDLAHALGLFAVAEGVETEAQRAELERIGCELAQGWLFGAALPATAIEDPSAVASWQKLSGSATPR